MKPDSPHNNEANRIISYQEITSVYKNSVCAVCRDKSLAVEKCARCKVVVYCGKDHQRYHWLIHKHECESLRSIRRFVLNNMFAFQYYTGVIITLEHGILLRTSENVYTTIGELMINEHLRQVGLDVSGKLEEKILRLGGRYLTRSEARKALAGRWVDVLPQPLL